MKLVCWNVNGIRAVYKKGLNEFLEREDPDIFCVQETKAQPEQLDMLQQHPNDMHAYWASAQRRGYSGVATFSKKPIKEVKIGLGTKKYDDEGRVVISKHEGFDLYNIYFPNGAAREERHLYKQQFLKDLTEHLKKCLDQGDSLVVVGDYNVAYLDIDVFDPVRLSKISGFLPEEREWFRKFLSIGFVDTFRHFYPDEKEMYTWWSYRENARVANRGWRIDHICVSRNFIDKVRSVEILDQVEGSDHCPIVAEFEV